MRTQVPRHRINATQPAPYLGPQEDVVYVGHRRGRLWRLVHEERRRGISVLTCIRPKLSQYLLTGPSSVTQEHRRSDWVGGGRASLARGHACSPACRCCGALLG